MGIIKGTADVRLGWRKFLEENTGENANDQERQCPTRDVEPLARREKVDLNPSHWGIGPIGEIVEVIEEVPDQSFEEYVRQYIIVYFPGVAKRRLIEVYRA